MWEFSIVVLEYQYLLTSIKDLWSQAFFLQEQFDGRIYDTHVDDGKY